jgi:hypothetical protein
MWVKRNQTNETNRVRTYEKNPFASDEETAALAEVFNGLKGKVNMLKRYFDLKHSATRFVTRDQSNRLRPDAYISHFRAQLRDIQKLHLTYAYLRAIAAVIFREIVETTSNMLTETGARVLPYSYTSLVDYIQTLIETNVNDTTLVTHVIMASEVVNSLARLTTKLKDTPIDISATAPRFFALVRQRLQALDIDSAPVVENANKNFGTLLAVYLFEKLNPAEILPDGPTLSWLEDDHRETISGTAWTVSFDMKLHTNHLFDLRVIFDGIEAIPWLTEYSLFKEEKGSNDRLYKHMFRVQYTTKQKYRFTVHHPYTDLYPLDEPGGKGKRIAG